MEELRVSIINIHELDNTLTAMSDVKPFLDNDEELPRLKEYYLTLYESANHSELNVRLSQTPKPRVLCYSCSIIAVIKKFLYI